ncbi:MAG: alpha-N-acetylglucosaminidase C-terminal domain-containing protein, partial [Bacteroidales bacterium]|nr:alpha-N-acetylglucosaminidase C-terminal domain-containing protein [Bacteroidales bacterium]
MIIIKNSEKMFHDQHLTFKVWPKRFLLLLLLLLFFIPNLYAQRSDIKTVKNLTAKIVPKEQAALFKFKLKSSHSNYFEIDASGKKVKIRGNSPVSIAAGIRHYLTHEISAPVRKESPYTAVLYFVDEHFDSITAEWSGKRWEDELDLMALYGVTHPLTASMLDKLPDSLSKKMVQQMRRYKMKTIDELPAGDSLKHICLFPQNIRLNPIAFDLHIQMVWQKEAPDMSDWIKKYPKRRYGDSSAPLQTAWEGFYQTVYHQNDPSFAYDHPLFAASCEAFFSVADSFQNYANYQFDAVNITQKYLECLGTGAYHNLIHAWNQGDHQIGSREAKHFLRLNADRNSLLLSHPAFSAPFSSAWIDAFSDDPYLKAYPGSFDQAWNQACEKDPLEAARTLFQKYRAIELASAVVTIELPISFKDGYGPFMPVFHLLEMHHRPTDLLARTRSFTVGTPTEWVELKRGVIPIDQNTQIAFVTGRDTTGEAKIVIDANNNRDFKDDQIFSLRDIDFNFPGRGHTLIPIFDTIPFCIGKVPGQEMLVGNFARHATTHLGEVEIAICSGSFSDLSFKSTELKIETDSQVISHGEFIIYQDTLYLNKGVDLNKNALILEKTVASKSQLFAPQIGFNAVPFVGEKYRSKDTISLDDYRGKYLVLYFWGTWNNACVEQLPLL